MTQRIIEIRALGQDRYAAFSDGIELCRSRRPFFDGARVLAGQGADDADELICKWADKETISFRSTVGAFRKLTVSESDRGGIRIAKWSPNPMFAGGAHG